MLISEVENLLDPILKRVLHDIVFHDLLGSCIKSSTSLTDDVSELFGLLLEHFEQRGKRVDDTFKLLVLKVHDLVALKNFENLLIHILNDGR